jgi:hypothetical protein
MGITLNPQTYMARQSSFSMHSNTSTESGPMFDFINRVYDCQFNIQPTRDDFEPHPVTWMPMTIPAGETEIRCAFSWGDVPAGEPKWGRYAIRYAGITRATHPFTFSRMYEVVEDSVEGRIVVDIPQDTGAPRFDIAFPEGPTPDGWYVEMIKLEHEAIYDDTSIPITDARRHLTPEFLQRLSSAKLYQYRFMKVAGTEASTASEISEYPPITAKYAPGGWWPIEVQVALCNYLGCHGYFCLPMNSSPDFIDTWGRYVRDNLDPWLEAKFEHGNEWWNLGGYASIRYYAWEAFNRFGQQGAGTVTLDADNLTLTGVGTDFVGELFPGANTIGCNGMAFSIKTDTLTATHADISKTYAQWLVSGTNLPWYYNPGSSGLMTLEGNVVRSALMAKQLTDIFAETGELHRLKRIMEVQMASSNVEKNIANIGDTWTDDDYIDPKEIFDVITVNPYFGSNTMKQQDFRDYLTTIALSGDQQAYNEALRDYQLGVPIPGIAESSRTATKFLRSKWKDHRTDCDLYGWELDVYEGGTHMVTNLQPEVNAGDAAVLSMFINALDSPEMDEILTAWAESHIPFCDGPVHKFLTFQNPSGIGVYAMWQGYWDTVNSHTRVLKKYQDMEPYWLPGYPPQSVAPLAPLQLTIGSAEEFDLRDYASRNVKTFSGTPPAGMTLNQQTGKVSGVPTEGGSGDYTFTGHNVAGTTTIVVPIVISG